MVHCALVSIDSNHKLLITVRKVSPVVAKKRNASPLPDKRAVEKAVSTKRKKVIYLFTFTKHLIF